jgi:uncharacterized membrane protein YjgN (DUF898 family)
VHEITNESNPTAGALRSPDDPPSDDQNTGSESAAPETPAPNAVADFTLPPDPLPSDPLVPLPPPVAAGPEAHPFRFHGEVDAFFRIWIVNTLLTLLTAGVFLAWAKVRKRRYLRGCTEVLGHRFDYRADPIRLLFGHVVMVLLFLGYSVFGIVYPPVRYGALVVGIVLLPWIVVRSIAFNAHNTVYRGIRFRFHPSLSAALLVYLLEPLLIVATLGWYYPAWERSKRRYVISNHRLGDAYFHFDGKVGPFYRALLVGGAILTGAALTGGIVLTLLMGKTGRQPDLLEMIPFFILYALGFFVSRHYIYARLFNHLWNNTRLDDHRFQADMRTGRWVGLQLANLGAIIASAGLLYPWSVIRAQRYAASCLSFAPAGSIDGIQRLGSSAGSAAGDTAAEFVGLDFGL